MDNKVKKICEILNISSNFKTAADYDTYISSIEMLRKYKSPEVLKQMLLSLSDVDAGELQYDLIEACEEYEDSIYVPVFMANSPAIKKNSPHWGELMLCSILNTPSCAEILTRDFTSKGSEALYEWINEIKVKYPKYIRIFDRIRI